MSIIHALKVLRLIRLVRLVKLYRHFESNKDQKGDIDMKLEDDDEEVEQSRVGQKLSGTYDHSPNY